MSAAVVVLTSPRKTDDPFAYLRRTLAELEVESDLPAPRVVLCDGDYAGPELPPGWSLVEYQRPAGALPGNKLAYWAALREGFGAGQACLDVLVLEDDLTLCRHALRRMVTLPISRDLAWLQFCSPHVLLATKAFPGLWRPPPASHLFTQALKYTARTVERLLEWQQSDPGFECFTTSDQTLANASSHLRLSYGVHCPDLVQHAGVVSAASPELTELDESRRAKCWPGPAFDALDLYTRDELYR